MQHVQGAGELLPFGSIAVAAAAAVAPPMLLLQNVIQSCSYEPATCGICSM